jgi:hypothetical protein
MSGDVTFLRRGISDVGRYEQCKEPLAEKVMLDVGRWRGLENLLRISRERTAAALAAGRKPKIKPDKHGYSLLAEENRQRRSGRRDYEEMLYVTLETPHSTEYSHREAAALIALDLQDFYGVDAGDIATVRRDNRKSGLYEVSYWRPLG